MNDENNFTNVEEDRYIRKTTINVSGSPVFDLSKQLQILNLGEDNKSKSKNTNFLSAPLQSIENLNSESQKTQSLIHAYDFNSLFPTLENEGANRNVFGEILNIDAGFESSIDTFLTSTIKPSASKRSLTDLESLMSDTVRPERSEMLSTPPKPSNHFPLETNSVDDVLTNDLLSGSDTCKNLFDNYFGTCNDDDAMKTDRQFYELFVPTTEVTETVTQATFIEENSGQLLLKIATPYKMKTISVHGLDSEESDYSKKRDLLMQSDKTLYGKIEGEKMRGRGRSLMAQMDEAFECSEISLEGKESNAVRTTNKDERENEENKMSVNGEQKCFKLGNDESFIILNENQDSACWETEGRKQVTFALTDEIIQPSPTSESDCSRLENNSISFELKSSQETQEIHLAEQHSFSNIGAQKSSVVLENYSNSVKLISPQEIHFAEQHFDIIDAPKSSTAHIDAPWNAEPTTPIASDSDSESDYQSLSSSINEGTPYKGGTPLALMNSAVQLENSWLNFSYHPSPNAESTFIVSPELQPDSPLLCKSISVTVIPEELESDLSDHFESLNSTIPDVQDIEKDEVVSDITPIPEDESSNLVDPDVQDIEKDEVVSDITPTPEDESLNLVDADGQDIENAEVKSDVTPTPEDESLNLVDADVQDIENDEVKSDVIPTPEDESSNLVDPDVQDIENDEVKSDVTPTPKNESLNLVDPDVQDIENDKVKTYVTPISDDKLFHVIDPEVPNRTLMHSEKPNCSITYCLFESKSEPLNEFMNQILLSEVPNQANHALSSETINSNLSENSASSGLAIEGVISFENEREKISPLRESETNDNWDDMDSFAIPLTPYYQDAMKSKKESSILVEETPPPSDEDTSTHSDEMDQLNETVLIPFVESSVDDINILKTGSSNEAATEIPHSTETLNVDKRHFVQVSNSSFSSVNLNKSIEIEEMDIDEEQNIKSCIADIGDENDNPLLIEIGLAVNDTCENEVEQTRKMDESVMAVEMTNKDIAEESKNKDTLALFDNDRQNLPEVGPVLKLMARKSMGLSPIRENGAMDLLNEGVQNNPPSRSLNETKVYTIENELEETQKLKASVLDDSMTSDVNVYSTGFEESKLLDVSELKNALENAMEWKLHRVNKTPVKLSPIMDLMNDEDMLDELSKRSLNKTVTIANENELKEFEVPVLDENLKNSTRRSEESKFLSVSVPNEVNLENPLECQPLLESINEMPIKLSPIMERNSLDLINNEDMEDGLSEKSFNKTKDNIDGNELEIPLEKPVVNVYASGLASSSSTKFSENEFSVGSPLRKSIIIDPMNGAVMENVNTMENASNTAQVNLADETQLFNIPSDQKSLSFTTHESESTTMVITESSRDAKIPQIIPIESPINNHILDRVNVSMAAQAQMKFMQILPSIEDQERIRNLSVYEPSDTTTHTEESGVKELLFDSNPSDDLPFTPKIPRSQTGLKRSFVEATKLPASLNRLLTPLRENISRLCTPMNVACQKNSSCLEISNSAPIFTLEESEDCNKTRLVLELPASLLDVSTTTLDKMFGQTDPLNFNTELNTDEGVEKKSTRTGKAEGCKNQIDLETHMKLEEEHERLKSICSALRHNEEELEQAYNKAKDCIRVVENRYEKLRDYTTRYICYMNEEYEKLETELKKANEERESLRSQLTQIQSAKEQ